MFEDDTYPVVIFFSKTTGHNNLNPYCKACRNCGKNKIKKPGKHRRS